MTDIKVHAPHDSLDVVAVDVQDGARQRRAVGAAPRLPGVCGEGDLCAQREQQLSGATLRLSLNMCVGCSLLSSKAAKGSMLDSQTAIKTAV